MGQQRGTRPNRTVPPLDELQVCYLFGFDLDAALAGLEKLELDTVSEDNINVIAMIRAITPEACIGRKATWIRVMQAAHARKLVAFLLGEEDALASGLADLKGPTPQTPPATTNQAKAPDAAWGSIPMSTAAFMAYGVDGKEDNNQTTRDNAQGTLGENSLSCSPSLPLPPVLSCSPSLPCTPRTPSTPSEAVSTAPTDSLIRLVGTRLTNQGRDYHISATYPWTHPKD